MEAYLDRQHGADWREAAAGAGAQPGARAAPGNRDMSDEEALGVLGLTAGATKKEIEQAYRRMIKMMHPDRGGSAYLATKINQAKDVLLGG